MKGDVNDIIEKSDILDMGIDVAHLDYCGCMTPRNLASIEKLLTAGVTTFVTYQLDGGRFGADRPGVVELDPRNHRVIMRREYGGLPSGNGLPAKMVTVGLSLR